MPQNFFLCQLVHSTNRGRHQRPQDRPNSDAVSIVTPSSRGRNHGPQDRSCPVAAIMVVDVHHYDIIPKKI